MELNTLTFKDFEILKQLGSGSFGKVQLARKKSDQKLYAIKSVLMPRLNQKEKQSALNQVRLLASISIPYVISYKGSFFNQETQSLCLVMEFADGGDLEGKINNQFKDHGKGFEETFIWTVAFEIFQGLKILHRNNIIHRDIKSANIFFVDGIAKLGDLNVSKVVENGMCSTQTGTPYYTSPEIWKGKKYGRKCDIWSTGCLIYELCTLHPPFRAKDFPALYRKVIVGNYDPIPSFYSQELSELIRMCLTVDDDMRPDASDLLETTILSGMELSLEKFRHEEGSISLINPIKCPRVLKFLNNKLPHSKFQEKGKKTVMFATKKQIEMEKIKNNSDGAFKNYKKIQSQKIINLNPSEQSTPSLVGSRKKIVLPPIQNEKDQALRFSNKKIRAPRNASEKKINCSRREISSKKDSRKNADSKKQIGSRKVLRIGQKQNSIKFIAG